MNTLILEKKKYVVLGEKEYENLLVKAASKTTPVRKLTLTQARKRAHKLINKWAKEK